MPIGPVSRAARADWAVGARGRLGGRLLHGIISESWAQSRDRHAFPTYHPLDPQ